MKTAVGFAFGMAFCLLLFTATGRYTAQVRAEETQITQSDASGIGSLLPDIGKIYRAALGSPYRQVESEIKDPDIARYYRTLMERTGLDKIGEE
jgi:hypothetical protein